MRKQKKQFLRSCDDDTKNDLIRQKQQHLLPCFMELNGEKPDRILFNIFVIKKRLKPENKQFQSF